VARPQRSTRDAWIDTFADWPADEQEAALDLAACVHRQTKRKAKPPANGNATDKAGAQPAATLLDNQTEAEAIR
jgi:hypothetical protein